jgi:hypothetical protein
MNFNCLSPCRRQAGPGREVAGGIEHQRCPVLGKVAVGRAVEGERCTGAEPRWTERRRAAAGWVSRLSHFKDQRREGSNFDREERGQSGSRFGSRSFSQPMSVWIGVPSGSPLVLRINRAITCQYTSMSESSRFVTSSFPPRNKGFL